MLEIDILTLFPSMFDGVFAESIIKRGIEKKLFSIKTHNLREWSSDKKHGKVDDTPYGGGAGMVMMVEPIYEALQDLRKDDSYIVLLSAHGNQFSQTKARKLATIPHLILICGHYEGVDQRVADYLIDEEISIGNFVLTGGEIPAMAIVDATIRLLPGVLGNSESLAEESFNENDAGIEYPHYTKPASFKDMHVPDVLLSGNHKEIKEWREQHKS